MLLIIDAFLCLLGLDSIAEHSGEKPYQGESLNRSKLQVREAWHNLKILKMK